MSTFPLLLSLGSKGLFIYLQIMIVLDHTIVAALGVLALVLGRLINGKVKFLSRICIPDPVTGGLVVSFLCLALKSITGMEISFDTSIQDICMLIFFTSIGFQCDLSAIKKGGKQLAVMIVLVAILIVLQNSVAVGIASSMGLEPVFGMVAGSIPMCGGHGTAAGFSELLESNGIDNARSITMATATFGLIAGSLIGGPIARMLIFRKRLSPEEKESGALEQEKKSIEKELSESEKMNRMKELVNLLNKAAEYYYQYSSPIMTDFEYDKLYFGNTFCNLFNADFIQTDCI